MAAIGRWARAVGVRVAGETETIVGFGGLALLGYGLWLAWNPLGYIVPGGLVFGIAVAGVVRRERQRRRG